MKHKYFYKNLKLELKLRKKRNPNFKYKINKWNNSLMIYNLNFKNYKMNIILRNYYYKWQSKKQKNWKY